MVGGKMPYREWLVKRLAECNVPVQVLGRGWVADEGEKKAVVTPYVRPDWGKYVRVLLRPSKIPETAMRLVEHVCDGARQRRQTSGFVNGVDGSSVTFAGYVAGRIEEVFSGSVVSIGASHLAGGWSSKGRCRRSQGRLRDFEVTAAGGFYLVQRHPDLADLYVEGREIEVWDDIEELVEKAEYFLEHQDEALEIARRGYERWRLDHTWERRFHVLLESLTEN